MDVSEVSESVAAMLAYIVELLEEIAQALADRRPVTFAPVGRVVEQRPHLTLIEV